MLLFAYSSYRKFADDEEGKNYVRLLYFVMNEEQKRKENKDSYGMLYVF